MGRPPLNLTRTHISFEAETLTRIDAIVGEKGRAKFIREATNKMLDSIELIRKLEAQRKENGPI